MKLLWHYLKQYKWLLILTLVLATINQVFSLLDPYILGRIIDKYANHFDQFTSNEFLKGVIFLLLAIVGVAFISRLAKNFQDYCTNVITQKLGAKLYNDSITHSFSLPYAVFEDQRSGEFLSKLQTARTDAQKLIQQTINILFFALVGVVFVLVYSFMIHWSIGLVFALMIPILAIITFVITKKIKTAQSLIVTEAQALAGSTTETLRNIELVKSLGLEQQEMNRLNDTNEAILRLELKKVKLIRTYSFIQGTIINALRAGLFLLMLWLIFTHHITLGQFLSLMFYSFFIFNPLAMLGDVSTAYQEAKASMEKLEQILKQPTEETPANPQILKQIQDITFQNVSFSYTSNTLHTLNDISLTIPQGKTIAFVGPSGSGKSTTIKMIVGLYQPTSGKVSFNNIDSKQIDFTDLRKRIGLVTQDTQLFAGTIKENLMFVRPSATEAEMITALQSASAMSILDRSTEGLDTKIGEGGLKLSGGEKQRLAIARALLRQPDILIFDEATSNLDSLTEEQITQTIKQIEQQHPNLIRILVAHRLSTVIHADTIFVLEKGRLIEQGTHQELLDEKGLYYALWRQQQATSE